MATDTDRTLREQAEKKYPDFPWLAGNEPEGVAALMEKLDWLEEGESIGKIAKSGEGNMNLTLRVRTDRRSVILKQARPWVEKYDEIAAPWDRILFEQRFYERASEIPEVAAMMPRFLAADSNARVLLLEDLQDAVDLSISYGGESIGESELIDLAHFLRDLHRATEGDPDPNFANRAMRELNYEHIYRLPLSEDLEMPLDDFEPGLAQVAQEMKHDAELKKGVKETGERYLADGRHLLHGDYFPGSWLRTPGGVRVIDPEFCFYGDREFDAGVTLGHLALSGQKAEFARRFLSEYEDESEETKLDQVLLARIAGTEVIRRLIGVAQLPIPKTNGWRAEMLGKARSAIAKNSMEALWV